MSDERPSTATDIPVALTMHQLADVVGRSRQTVGRWVRQNLLPEPDAIRVDGRLRSGYTGLAAAAALDSARKLAGRDWHDCRPFGVGICGQRAKAVADRPES